MSAKDISRFLFQPSKRYSGVRMQQGRVILDSDWNESERIDDEELRRTLVDVICSKGTSNNGFRVVNVRNADVGIADGSTIAAYDFDVEKGSFYIGGVRFETDAETFLGQRDWLQIDAAAGNLPTRPDDLAASAARLDLIYLRGWEQCVTVVEDSELRERALGGPDTSVRIRRMRRVEVLPDVPETCATGFNALKQKLGATFTPEYELQSNARLTVVPNPGDITEDPCKPAVPGGYLGAENQTLRVQLTAANRLIWGYENASPFYRVQVENIPDVPQGVDGTGRRIRFLTLPRDQAAQPLAGQAVEIIPWGALLPNQEKVAEFQGQLFTVETSFDPESNSLTITQPVSQESVQWLADHAQFESAHDAPEQRQYFYLRLWTGASGDAAQPDFPFVAGNPVALKGTGLSVTFTGDGLPGDFWIIAARPSTPSLVVPWELLDSAAPAGPRYFFAPLALVRWSRGANALQPTVHDCRERFRPLCDARGCCTVTVGDGISSHGDFDSIEEAVAFLPDAGGEVCLLPGQHRADVAIVSRRNITIKGCDKLTQVIPRDANQGGAIFRIVDSRRIALRGMEMITLAGTAITLESSGNGVLQEIDISENRIVAALTAIQVRQGVDIHIRHNRIRMLDKDGSGIAIRMLADDSVIERNDIGVVPADRTPPPDVPDDTPDPTDPCADPELLRAVRFLRFFADHIFAVVITAFPTAPFKALGGIQIAAGSERVKVLENAILGGAGNGITLGGTIPVPAGPILSQTPQTIESAGDRIQGQILRADGTAVPGISVSFTRADGVVRTAVSGSGGFFTVRTEPGPYSVAVGAPAFQIENITARDDAEFGRLHHITLAPVERPAPDDALGFLYEIRIDRNEISLMGLSGIGYPMVAPDPILLRSRALSASAVTTPAAAALLELLGNPVLALGIHRNHIHGCFQNLFDTVLRDEATRRGFGGISLGFCEDVTISSNRIERNGRSHLNPVCGIFIRFGEKVNIHHNHIAHNGPFATSLVQRGLDPGVRGGIVLFASCFGIEEVFLRGDLGFDVGRHAARVQENIVYQPAGHALRLLAIGPVSVCDNHLVTELNGPEVFERLAGAVFVLTAGGAGRLPAGVTLFNSNQTRLGDRGASLTSQIVWTTDDIGFDGNQSEALTKGIPLTAAVSILINTFLLGRTLRATDSRFKEPIGREQAFTISLLTRTSILNNTNDNHGDHCIFAVNTAPGRPAIVSGNQVVDSTLCPTLNNSIAAPISGFAVSATIRG